MLGGDLLDLHLAGLVEPLQVGEVGSGELGVPGEVPGPPVRDTDDLRPPV